MSASWRTARALALEIAGELGATGILAIGSLLTTTLAALGLWQLAQEHWPHIVVGMALVNFVIVWIVSRRSRRALRIIESSGITRYWPARDKSEAWQACAETISKREEILIADATGAEMHDDSALGKALGAHVGDIKVIMLRPDSPAFEQYVSDVAGSDEHAAMVLANQYQSERERALQFFIGLCDRTKRKRRSIEIRECDHGAIWKTVISGERLWLEHEATRPDDGSPMYMLTRDKGTVAPSFEKLFFERWDSGRIVLQQKEPRRERRRKLLGRRRPTAGKRL